MGVRQTGLSELYEKRAEGRLNSIVNRGSKVVGVRQTGLSELYEKRVEAG